uniref:SLED domain-containing protein n=2 Tax=Ascaris TaxID=6251 RepID=A0A9J2PSW1_ASCLU
MCVYGGLCVIGIATMLKLANKWTLGAEEDSLSYGGKKTLYGTQPSPWLTGLMLADGSETSDSPTPTTSTTQCACVGEFLKRICNLRRTQLTFEGDLAFVSNQERRWSKVFSDFIVGNVHCTSDKCSAHSDDMLWYVPMQQRASQNSPYSGLGNGQLQVYRRQSPKQPAAFDSGINWEETVCLNLILQQLDFHVTCAVCTKTSPQNLQILRKNCQRVYPSPSRRRMDSKGDCEEITFPKIYFAIDDFEQIFSDVIVRDGECVCVELVARDRYKNREAVIFLGSIRYEVLKQVYDTRASTTWHWAQRLISSSQRRQEFVRMRGPHGKGYAEMAVARVANCGFETPMSDQPMDFDGSNSLDQYNRRRLSDTNLSHRPVYNRSAMTPGPSGCQTSRARRWQSEADTVNQYPEVEANTIDDELDENVLSRLWSVRGFGQAWHWLREKRRAECTPLNAYLTYVTLPWSTILDDLLLERPRRPILTFDLSLPELKTAH